MRIVNIFVLASFLLAYSIAWSEDNDFKCNPEGKQSQLNACTEDDFTNADRELNRVYKELISKIPPQKQDTLRKEQRVWLSERDPNCKKEANSEAEGGSMWPMIFNGCRATVTKARIQALQKWQ